MTKAMHYLRRIEWSMGNGQCPECCGVGESFYLHPLYEEKEKIGHKQECLIAEAILELGEKPLMVGEYKGD